MVQNEGRLARSWEDIERWHGELLNSVPKRRWLFRGQRSADWNLETTLDRAVERHDVCEERVAFERRLLREFMRHAQRFPEELGFVPDKDDYIAWLSVMRHFGGRISR